MSDDIPVVHLGPEDTPAGDYVLIEVLDRYSKATQAKIVGGSVQGVAVGDLFSHADPSLAAVIEEAKRHIEQRYSVPVTIYVNQVPDRV